jgi:hypothetical protein
MVKLPILILILILAEGAYGWISSPEREAQESYSLIPELLDSSFLLSQKEIKFPIIEKRAISIEELTNKTGLVPSDFENLTDAWIQRFPESTLVLLIFSNSSEAHRFFLHYKSIHRSFRMYGGDLPYGYESYRMDNGIVLRMENGIFVITGEEEVMEVIHRKVNLAIIRELLVESIDSSFWLLWILIPFLLPVIKK